MSELIYTEDKYAISMIGTPFIDVLIKHGIIDIKCHKATIVCEAGREIRVTQTVLIDCGYNDPDTLESLEALAQSRVPKV